MLRSFARACKNGLPETTYGRNLAQQRKEPRESTRLQTSRGPSLRRMPAMVPPHYIRFRNRNRGQIDLKALRVAVPIVGPLRCTEDVPWRGLTTEEWLRRVGRSSIFGYR